MVAGLGTLGSCPRNPFPHGFLGLSLSDSSAYAVETWGSAVTALLDPQGKKAIIIRGDKARLDTQRDRLYAAQGNSVVEYDWAGIWTTAQSLNRK